jgi:diaminopimelate decarboxylase
MKSTTFIDEHALSTPFFCFDEARFCDNIQRFRSALQKQWQQSLIAYSIKTNYVPGICAIARDLGCYGEAVSTMELELVQHLAFEKNRSIFNGPNKSIDDFRLAIKLGSIIHLDSLDQVKTLLSLSKTERASVRVGLRINVDLSRATGVLDKIATGGFVPRFGMTIEDALLAHQMIRTSGHEVISLHGHASSSDRKPDNYSQISLILLSLAEKAQLKSLEFLDVGGGFSGELPAIWNHKDSPSYDDYASAIFAPLLASKWFHDHKPSVIIEPGMGIVADCMSYVTSVVSTKRILTQNLAMMDGNFYDVRPTFHAKPLPCSLLGEEGGPDSHSYTLTGSTCMERDILNKDIIFSRELVAGDRITIGNVGAYCNVLSPHFINYAAPIYCKTVEGKLRVLRQRQTFNDFFVNYEQNV